MTRYTAIRRKAEQGRFCVPCHLCDERHPIRVCPVYRGKTPEERLRQALLGRFCGNCLSTEHQSDACPSERRCRRCNEKHHTTLHIDEDPRANVRNHPSTNDEASDVLSIHATDVEEGELPESAAESRSFRPALERGSEPRPFRPLLQHETRIQALTRHQPGAESRSFRPAIGRGSEPRPFRPRSQPDRRPRGPSNPNPVRRVGREGRLVTRPRQLSRPYAFRNGIPHNSGPTLQPMMAIAPTAIVKVEAGGRLHLIRALIDVCSARTVIALDLARELRLEETWISGERGCLLCLRGKHGQNQRVATHAVALPNFRRISPASSADPAVAEPYALIRLADPRFYGSAPVRLVLGADVYANIVVPGTLPTTFGPLLAQSTIFGWVLSGVLRA